MEPGGGPPASQALTRRSGGAPFALDPSLLLGAGGEARIFAVPCDPGLAVKVYRKPTRERERKLSLMIAKPPAGLSREEPSLAWPLELVDEVGGGFAGFVMPRVTGQHRAFELYNPAVRKRRLPGFDWGYLHRAARNLAAVAASLHEAGYVIGDINESNVLVAPTARVTILDTDSFRVPDRETGQVFFCTVGKPEFSSPELQGKSFTVADQTLEDDLFGLATLLFLMLMEGTHPFAGEYTGAGEPPMFGERIARGFFPYARGRSGPFRPRRLAPPLEILHPRVRELFLRCFEDGHADPRARPSAAELRDALGQAEAELARCSANDRHLFGRHLSSCPWCERAKALGGRDPFPSRDEVFAGRPAPEPGSARASPRLEVERLQSQVATNPDAVGPRAELATLLAKRGREEEARRVLERAADAYALGSRNVDDFRALLGAARLTGGGEALSQILRRTDVKPAEVPAILELGPLASVGLSAPIQRRVERVVAERRESLDTASTAAQAAVPRPAPGFLALSAWPAVMVAVTALAALGIFGMLALKVGALKALLIAAAGLFNASFTYLVPAISLAPFRTFARLKLLTELCRSKAGSLPASGIVEVSGVARAHGPSIRSPFAAEACAFWQITAGDKKKVGRLTASSNQTFVVEDATGLVPVRPEGATLFASTPSARFERSAWGELVGPAGVRIPRSAWDVIRDLQAEERLSEATEWRLEDGKPIAVIGWAETAPGGPTTVCARKDVPLLIMESKEATRLKLEHQWIGFLAVTVLNLVGYFWLATTLR